MLILSVFQPLNREYIYIVYIQSVQEHCLSVNSHGSQCVSPHVCSELYISFWQDFIPFIILLTLTTWDQPYSGVPTHRNLLFKNRNNRYNNYNWNKKMNMFRTINSKMFWVSLEYLIYFAQIKCWRAVVFYSYTWFTFT